MHAWDEAVAALGGNAPGAVTVELDNRYAEPHRCYHTAEHVAAVLRDAKALADAVGLHERDRALVDLAACAHDVIHTGVPGEDERASAGWARRALDAAGIRPADAARVEELVLFTADHRVPDNDTAAGVLVDADLAILGGTAVEHDAYVAAVRAEYGHVPDPQWRVGRTRVLEQLLAVAPLYRTQAARERWEQQAQLNIRRELAALRG